mmetsp:Transcript_118382/g.330190  ORF Transcript_118382/g.330190 Transcript_118382/m.330190 type:complete len:216 (-) Transcript_118382:574-1221(-)
MQKIFSTLTSTADCVHEKTGVSGHTMVPSTSTTDSSGSAPAKPAGSAPTTTVWTVARSCRKVRKQSLLLCFRLLCTRARIQTFWSLRSGVKDATGVHSRPVFRSLCTNKFPNVCSSKSSSVTSGPLNFASFCLCCSSSLRRFSSSLAFFASSLAFFFSSFLLLEAAPSSAASVGPPVLDAAPTLASSCKAADAAAAATATGLAGVTPFCASVRPS